jgi:hypothetical protein
VGATIENPDDNLSGGHMKHFTCGGRNTESVVVATKEIPFL